MAPQKNAAPQKKAALRKAAETATATPFLTDVTTLRARARDEIGQGPVTAAYGSDLDRVLKVLNDSLATEIVCVLRYRAHYYGARGLNAMPARRCAVPRATCHGRGARWRWRCWHRC